MLIKFYCAPYQSAQNASYQHCCVAIAEGLRSLGIPFFGNTDYWFENETGQFLIKKGSIQDEHNICIYSSSYLQSCSKDNLKLEKDKKNILIDDQDGKETFSKFEISAEFDLVLKTHFTKYIKQRNNVVPWAFGLTERIVREIDKESASPPFNAKLLLNYRIGHSLRSYVNKKFFPTLSQQYEIVDLVNDHYEQNSENQFPDYWNQTGRRHNPEYYRTISKYPYIFVVGGIFENRVDPSRKLLRQLSQRLFDVGDRLNLKITEKLNHIYQFDSWRLWEGFYSNSVPIHMDFEKWGFMLPIDPKNYVHYVGIESNQPIDFLNRMNDIDRSKNIEIAQSGKKWAFDHYSPKPTAERFLKLARDL